MVVRSSSHAGLVGLVAVPADFNPGGVLTLWCEVGIGVGAYPDTRHTEQQILYHTPRKARYRNIRNRVSLRQRDMGYMGFSLMPHGRKDTIGFTFVTPRHRRETMNG